MLEFKRFPRFKTSLNASKAELLRNFLFLLKNCRGEFSQLRALLLSLMHQYPNVFKYAKFDSFALCCLASKLRQGSRCICDPSQTPACSSFNWAILLTFVDGVQWGPPFPKRGQSNKVQWDESCSFTGQQQKIQVSQGQQYHADKDRESLDYSDDAISKTLYLLSSRRRCNLSEIPYQGR